MTRSATITGVDDPNVPTEVTICEREPKDGGTFAELPFALTPGRPFPTGKLRESIDTAAAGVVAVVAGFGDVEIEAAGGLEPVANPVDLWHLVGHGRSA